MNNKITFKKVKFQYHPEHTKNIIITATRWVMLLDGKRISNTYISNSIGSKFQCIYKGEALSRLIMQPEFNHILFTPGHDNLVTIVEDFKTLLEAKRALVEHFNQHFDENK